MAIVFVLLALVFFIAGSAIDSEDDGTPLHLLGAAFLFVALLCVAPSAFAQDWGLSYECSTETHDIYQLTTDSDTIWTLVPQHGEQVVANHSGRYSFPKGGVYVWVGTSNVGLANVGNTPCGEGITYVEPMIECLGFYAGVETFYVDGVEYQANSDGWVSFLVPQDAVWVWNTSFGYYEQTESEVCHFINSVD